MKKTVFLLLKLFIVVLVIGVLLSDSESYADVDNSEMGSVMRYMGKKIAIDVSTGTSCVNGTVSGSKCDMTTCVVSTANVVQSSVNQGSGSLTCVAGYSGSPTYTCNNGTFTPGGTACTVISCTSSGITGINNGTSFPYASSGTSFNCNASGYTGTVTYTCTTNGANPSISTNNCTAISCTSSGITGINNGTSFPYASSGTSFNCNASGYTGTVTYTCTTNGANPSISTNNCTSSCYNYSGHCYTYVGSYNLGSGPAWSTNPPTYTCQEACAIRFGNSAGNYRCSTTSGSITATGIVDQFAVHTCSAQSDTYKVCSNYSSSGCISAYIADGCGSSINYCFLY